MKAFCLIIVCFCFRRLWGFRVRSLFYLAVLCVLSSFAIMRVLVALLLLCSECHVAVIVFWALSRGAISWFVVIVAFPDHTYLFF